MKRFSIRRPSPVALAVLACGGLAFAVLPPGALAQSRPYQPESVSASEYARAEQFLPWHAEKLTSGVTVNPRWVDANRFWYRNQVFGGHEFIMIDAAARTRRPAFDHDRLAAALSEASDASHEATHLPFDEFEFNASGGIRFWTDTHERWDCDIAAYRCTGPDSVARATHGDRCPRRRARRLLAR